MQLDRAGSMKRRSLRFECFALDLERLSVHAPSGQVDLRPKSFEVLRYFAEHAGRVVTKDEVIKAVWPDVTVTDESLTRCISDVRHALGDERQRIIKTVPRRGYLFDVPVSPADATADATDGTDPQYHRREPASTRGPERNFPCPTSRRSPCFLLFLCPLIPGRSTSPMASPRTSSRDFPN